MKLLITTPLIFALCAGTLLAQKPAASGKTAEDELRQLENSWTDAQKTKNVDRLNNILADDWVGLGWDGQTSDKAKALAELKAPGNSLESIQTGPMRVRIYGTTAVVTGTNTEKSKEHGADSSGKYVWTDVFVKQQGQWKAVASQSAKAAE